MQIALKILTIAVLCFAVPVHASFLHWPERSLLPQTTDLFLPDNEHYPQDALAILKRTVSGVFLAVGTERGLNNFTYSGATHLFLADYNPAAVLYNRLSILLLKGATDLEMYRQLKTDRVFLRRHLTRLRLSPVEINTVREIVESEWYSHATFSLINGHWEVNLIWKKPTPAGPYEGANYVFDTLAFHNLQTAAREGRIQAELVDLSDLEDIRELTEQMKKERLRFSMIELSNAWESHFIGPENLPAILDVMRDADADPIAGPIRERLSLAL